MLGPIIRLLAVALVLALLALFARQAGAQDAQPAPALRANVTVTGEIVRIGDLVENAGAVADVPIFRAPDLGTRGAVTTERILAAIQPHQLVGVDTRGLSEVLVTRASRAITAQEISARVAQALAGQYGLGEARNIAVSFDRAVHTLHIEAGAAGELEVVALAYDPRTTRFDVSFDLPTSAVLRRLSPRYTGTALETIETVMVEHPVERGEVLKASDLVVERRGKADGTGLTDIKAAVGLAARRQLRPGQPLHEADLMKPPVVQRNDTVTIVYEAPGLTLTLRGQAQESGAMGDTIGVLNVQSKRLVHGVVSAPGRVTVSAATTRLVDNAPASAPAVRDLPSANFEQQHGTNSTE